MTLLQEAKKISRYKNKTGIFKKFSQEELQELAIAWLKDEIITHQAMKATGQSSNSVIYQMAMSIKELYQQGKIKIN